MAGSSEETDRFDELYGKFVKPLEAEHWGEFAAVSAEGNYVLGRDVLEVLRAAEASLGPGAFIYKIGDVAVARWR